MSVTLALALWGAIVSSGLAVMEFLKYLGDRTQLAIAISTQLAKDAPPAIQIEVRNTGRRATTLIKVALRHDDAAEVEANGRHLFRGHLEDVFAYQPYYLEADKTAVFSKVVGGWPGMTHADMPLRPYVVEARRNRVTWGPAIPLLRLLVSGGWRPPSVDPKVLTPPSEPWKPARVHPRWKLWKPPDFICEPGTGRPIRTRGRFEA